MAHDPVALTDLKTEAHVWLARPRDIEDSQQLDEYRDLLSEAERDRHERFHFEVHRKLFLVSHALLRISLSRYAEVSPENWRFSEGEFGRPEVSGPAGVPALRFNLSHTEGLAACVVCLDIDCGVDVERMNRVKDLDGVARRVFTSPEREDLQKRDGDSLQGRFADYWTLKEAYMKARGKGFQLPPHTFTMRIEDCDEPRVRLDVPPDFDDQPRDWQLAVYPLSQWQMPEYRLGVALRTGTSGSRRIVVRETSLRL